jgi:hypothetical protein
MSLLHARRLPTANALHVQHVLLELIKLLRVRRQQTRNAVHAARAYRVNTRLPRVHGRQTASAPIAALARLAPFKQSRVQLRQIGSAKIAVLVRLGSLSLHLAQAQAIENVPHAMVSVDKGCMKQFNATAQSIVNVQCAVTVSLGSTKLDHVRLRTTEYATHVGLANRGHTKLRLAR